VEGHDGCTYDKPIMYSNSILSHMVSSKEYTAKEKEIQYIKNESDISYVGARKHIIDSNDSFPASKASYAGTANRTCTSSETEMTLTWLQECNKLYHVPISWKYCYYTHSMQRKFHIIGKSNHPSIFQWNFLHTTQYIFQQKHLKHQSHRINFEWMRDCWSTPIQQCFSHIMARTS
jgi:hypothetical protein